MNGSDIPDCYTCSDIDFSNCLYQFKYFRCTGCGKDVPWCFGCAHDDPGLDSLCDACFQKVMNKETMMNVFKVNIGISIPCKFFYLKRPNGHVLTIAYYTDSEQTEKMISDTVSVESHTKREPKKVRFGYAMNKLVPKEKLKLDYRLRILLGKNEFRNLQKRFNRKFRGDPHNRKIARQVATANMRFTRLLSGRGTICDILESLLIVCQDPEIDGKEKVLAKEWQQTMINELIHRGFTEDMIKKTMDHKYLEI